MAAPPSLNLLGEIGLLSSLVSWSWLLIQHGSVYSGLYTCSLGYVREFLLLFLHWFPLNVIVLRVDVANTRSYGAGMLTVLSNRIGDVALLMVIAWIINFGSWSFVYYLDFLSGSVEMELISFLVVLAAMTRSAQIPFSSWLPAAMAAPTPVSALVHSSTLVTAGVYLLIRFSPSFGLWLNGFLLLISGLTIFIAGLGANFEYDLRRIIALSTLRQLGLMIMTISVGLPGLAFFHLLTHALFRALLFICAGGVIHSLGDSQDIRFMGGLSVCMPFTSSRLIVSNFALCGIPFLAGFYSRDFILEMFSMGYVNIFSFFLLFLSTGLTGNSFMVFGMVGLLVMSVFGGSFLMWLVCPTPSVVCWYGSTFFSGSMWFMPFLSTYSVSFWPLEGIYWASFNLSKVNQWVQYNGLRFFLGFFVMWVIILLFVLVYYLDSLFDLERDTEDVNEPPYYSLHSSDPWFHSWYKPIIRISRNMILTVIHDFMFDVIIVTGIGSSRAISTSKIMKITAIRKNRDEKGRRAEFLGSNPHSNDYNGC
ncbi:NADH dehydrogenase subunit 5 (mitochondrion)-like protein [Dinothrombium tinctorium]|uniref:NADH:ubiquinone reductase (H(+)-translocating) n=1 Tax=Dinothrombium tinctorium TaxID=1965070 RepID=A0A3S3RTY6_9ACAR|nr:NADH dehydrogenase subunit 5 (mitochondrion)-like protein [Dinothrombium tinctorium]